MNRNKLPKSRSDMMASIRSKGTAPEMSVRRTLHRLGYRYRLHCADLPGRPDLVFPSRRKVIFVNGCFWHQHSGCKRASIPKSNRDFWLKKLHGNLIRDARNADLLRSEGWGVETVWECELQNPEAVGRRLAEFLGKKSRASWAAAKRTTGVS